MSTLSFFRRLASDPTANTIVISAVAMVPLIGMVGGAVDASRYYMSTTRLQAACDAGALAARRAMDDGNFSSEDETVGNNFFDQNYRDGQFGLEDRTRVYSANNQGVVSGTATGRLPTSLMHIFGYDEFDISVDCSADINIANTDIMFVLDVTGSMNCPADRLMACGGGGNNNNSEFQSGGSNASRIQALRDAVLDFYDIVDGSTSPQAQVRYGFLPYSSGVNVGADIVPWMANNASYESRTWVETTTEVPGNGVEIGDWILDRQAFEYMPRQPRDFGGGIWISSYQWRNNDFNSSIANSSTRSKCLRTQGEEYLVGNELWRVTRAQYWLNVWNGFGASVRFRAACVGNIDKFRRADADDVEESETISVAQWSYRERNFDVSNFYSGSNVVTDTGPGGTNVSHSWNGCIEEADTVPEATFNPLPNGAFDLDINLVPSTDEERWKPALPGAVYYRHETADAGDGVWDASSWLFGPVETIENLDSVAGVGASLCPTAARRLDENLTRGQVQTYVNSLTAQGATYHDFGMIWGGRYISPNGIFAGANATAPNGDSIARHIVFMTDGTQATERWVYGLYGIEFWDRRITTDGTSNQMAARHAERFQAACRAARNQNISVWVVAFGTDLDQNLRDCATSGRAFEADNATDLADTFKDIAEQIADLRLTQ